MNKEEAINILIEGADTNNISDGYHTFGDLYNHRITLYIALCRILNEKVPVWRSKQHSDGSEWQDWYILGIFYYEGMQITYHIPINRWNETDFAKEITCAPTWDGHTSEDVLRRISRLYIERNYPSNLNE